MRLSQLADRWFKSPRRRAGVKAIACAIDLLEARRLFAGESVETAIAPVLANTTNPAANSITLNQHFTDSTIPGTLTTFNTSLGTITVALTDAATPLTVANFLSYISDGSYTDTIFHRSALLASTSGRSDIIQGGGYVVRGQSFPHIATRTPVQDEYTTESFGDIAGTLAMAKTSSANSATSEWYFNVNDNTTALDTPTTDSSGKTTSYTVFGKVLTGLNIVDEIAGLPTYNVSSSLTTVPVVGLSDNQVKKKFPITAGNLVYTDSISSQPGTNYTVTSDNNALVTPTVNNGVLSFTYASGLSGVATITIVAKNLDGTTASSTFAVTVANTATPTAGPVAAAVTAPDIVSGESATFNVLAGGTDSVSPLDSDSVTIVTAPTHGLANVNQSTGLITYKANAGYTGSDTLTYTVKDAAGTVSNTAAVTLNVIAAPVTVTIGTRAARSLTFTQPNGVVGTLTVKGGTALVTFASSSVATSTANNIVSATGAGTTLASIVITNNGPFASLSLTSSGSVSIGSITDSKAVSFVDAPAATLVGDATFGGLGRLVLAGMLNSTLTPGKGLSTSLAIPIVTDSSVIASDTISSITSKQWLNDNGGYYIVSTPRLDRLSVTGTFADVLNVSSAQNAVASTSVGNASAEWTFAGSIRRAAFGAAASTWSLNAAGSVTSLNITGNLSSNVSAASIGTLLVTGNLAGSTINTTSVSAGTTIGRLQVGGGVSNSFVTVNPSGSIGSVTAASFTSSNVSAGAIGSVLLSGNAVSSDFITNGRASAKQIGRFKIGGTFNTSSVSATGSVGPFSAASLNSGTLTAGSIDSVVVAGGSTGSNITANANNSAGKLQIGSLRVGGAFNTSSVSASGSVGTVSLLSLSASQITTGSLGSAFIAGVTNGGTIETNATFVSGKVQMGRLVFGGAVQGSLINAVGNIGSVTAPSLTGCQIYAGVNSAESQAATLPTGSSQFTANAHISSVVLAKTGTAFTNSLISADSIGTTRLGNINTSNNTITEGVAAHKINHFSGTLVPGGVLNAGPKQLKSAATLAAYESAQKVTLGDFVVRLL